MSTDNPYPPGWPGEDDRVAIEEMLRDSQSEHWKHCREFVKQRVRIQAKNISPDSWEDIVQETMRRIGVKLRSFEHKNNSTLRTWIISITSNCIADEARNREREEEHIAHSEDSHTTYDDGEPLDTLITPASNSTEDMCIMHEKLQEVLKTLLEHLATRNHPERDKLIVEMVIFKGYSHEAAAKVVGCSAAVVGYVVRTAQENARKKHPPEL